MAGAIFASFRARRRKVRRILQEGVCAMSHIGKHRRHLPQCDGKLFLTDGGIETTLIFLEGLELPHFAAFDLLRDRAGWNALRKYYERYLAIAVENRVGFVLESATWRASADWGSKLGYSAEALAEANRDSIKLLAELRKSYESSTTPTVISGCLGPRGDGYDPGALMSVKEAQDYHAEQVAVFADTEADMVSAITMTNVNEAIGLTRAAMAANMPVAISFTVETDGKLPTGQSLQEAIEAVDAATSRAPAYYMINCAHPSHFDGVLTKGAWRERIGGVRANASVKSHAELNESTELDAGNPTELGAQYRELRKLLPKLIVLGGCCGTDHRHVEAICTACLAA
jgi:S-methylmethionine-dependent homocysteine/selenocysteine methylase